MHHAVNRHVVLVCNGIVYKCREVVWSATSLSIKVMKLYCLANLSSSLQLGSLFVQSEKVTLAGSLLLGKYVRCGGCRTNMRTRTKRTRGTENLDAFIRLNMRIVRVAHFFFITQVERQLCIVNRGYAIVTKQQ
jgi:hypothetical protein